MSASPFDHPLLKHLLGDPETAHWLSAESDLRAMLDFELALTFAASGCGVSPEAAGRIISVINGFTPDLARLAEATARDGVPVPELVRQLRAAVGEPHAAGVHFAATSQDVVDSSLMVRLKGATQLFDTRLEALSAAFDVLAHHFGDATLIGRTRMQDALPITVADRVAAWRAPLARLRSDLPPEIFAVQFGGPVGTLAELGAKAGAVRASLAHALGLTDVPAWHGQRDRIVRIADWLATVSGSLGKFGQDVALMALTGDVVLTGGGGSSAMPHKQNPVGAEVLVALARYAATLVGGMHHAQVHELERSGTAWTLEWLILPQLVMSTGAGLRIALELCGRLTSLGVGRPHG